MVIVNYVFMCIIFGTTFLGIKIGIDAGAPPFFSAGVRFFLAGLVLFIWMVLRKKADLSLLFHKEMWVTGFCLTFGTFAALYWAEQYVSSGTAAILSATAPIMILLTQVMILRERVSPKAALGCILGFAGIILLVLPQISIQSNQLWLIGCLAILGGQIFYSSGALYSKRVIRQFAAASPIALNAAQMIYGGLMLFVLSLFTENLHSSIESMLTIKSISALLYLIIVGSMAGHTIFYVLVAKTNPVFPSTWLYVSPIIAMALGIILYSEPFSWFMAAGTMTILTGVMLVNLDALQMMVQKTWLQRRPFGKRA